MKIRNNFIIGSFLEKRVAVLAWGVLMALLLTAAGCQRREAEFLEEAAQAEEAPGTPSDAGGQTENSSGSGEDAGKEDARPEGDASSEDAAGEDSEAEGKSAEKAGQAGENAEQPETIFVDVCGAVKSPGVFELAADSRVFQAVEAAGGLIPEAAGEYVNLAVRLDDGQQIYIPTREEAERDPDFESPLEKSASGSGAASADAQAAGAGKVNLNTADESALTTLTGIGASKAQAILAYREEHGGFSAIEDILNVPGIKEGTFMKIKDNIAVE